MIKLLKNIVLFSILSAAFTASAQTTGSSPYSQFGLGLLKGSYLPQNRAMGDISAGLRRIGLYNNINLANPASYSAIRLTTFDIGAYSGITQLSNSAVNQKGSFNGALSHIVFAIPTGKKAALSFGLIPYSDFGYKYSVPGSISSNGTTYQTNFVYSGEGGLSKSYIGYGYQFGKHLSLGVNATYLFGKLSESNSTEFPTATISFLNSRTSKNTSVGGLVLDYGVQYFTDLGAKSRLTIGYSGTTGNKIGSTQTNLTTRYITDGTTGEESVAADTVFYQENARVNMTMPFMHTVGFTFENQKWLLGADFSTSSWSQFKIGNGASTLQDSYTASLGGQFTPNSTSVAGSYFNLIDYRFGMKYGKTSVKLKGTDITQRALTVGFGFPLPSARTSFYKINLSAEIGKRGTLDNNLVRENFVNFNLGFTLNDQWFQKFKFD